MIGAVLLVPGELPFLREMIALFTASTFLAWACHRLGVVPIVGFLIAGVIVGPFGLGLVRDAELVSSTAEIGVILLLFSIGVEFSLEKLGRIRRFILLGGGVQVAISVALVVLVLLAFGVGWRVGIYTGFLVALSSTAIVLKLLADGERTDTPAGRISLGILIFQDLSIVLMVLLVPALGSGRASGGEIALALLEAAVIIGIVIELGRRIVPRLLDRIALQRSPELFLLAVVSICFGIAWVLKLGGVSLALGAFLAGLAVSGSHFREQAIGDILPLRTLFTAVFFASVGMLLDLRVVLDRPFLILGIALAVALAKFLTTGVAVLALRYPPRLACSVALGLAQIGEFSLVLEPIGSAQGLFPADAGPLGQQVFLGVAVLLMAVTPFFARLEERLVEGLDVEGDGGGASVDSGAEAEERPVIIGGYGMAGRAIERACIEAGIPYRVVDLNPVSVVQAQARAVPIALGDVSRRSVLEHAGLRRARCLALAMNDQEAVIRAIKNAKLLRPDLRVIVRIRYAVDEGELREAGADEVVVEEREAAERLAHLVCVPSERGPAAAPTRAASP